MALTGAAVGAHAGTAALAGYATAARLEYLIMPIAFGLGAPMVALVGANIGAGQYELRAQHCADRRGDGVCPFRTGRSRGFTLASRVAGTLRYE
ncbi:hypothetical protein [Paraburkholderia youngii]|uniref:hypothetical protein n=1 Tax=Paraburkholderia youngii TaxID=2782701 RepID=UPI003D1F635F